MRVGELRIPMLTIRFGVSFMSMVVASFFFAHSRCGTNAMEYPRYHVISVSNNYVAVYVLLGKYEGCQCHPPPFPRHSPLSAPSVFVWNFLSFCNIEICACVWVRVSNLRQ